MARENICEKIEGDVQVRRVEQLRCFWKNKKSEGEKKSERSKREAISYYNYFMFLGHVEISNSLQP